MTATAPLAPTSHPDLLDTVALYIHIPFCHTKCHYCDFNSYAGMLGWRAKYVQALCHEIAGYGAATRHANGAPRRCRTIFFGGGTPSLLRPDDIALILATTRAGFAVDADAEITLEANPASLERGPLGDMRATGLNRLSMGAQSFDAGLLKWMGRIHSPAEIVSAVHAARRAGFANVNLDFIFALPDQTLAQWRDTLERAIDLAPEHLSLYSLIVEPTTPLFDWVESGKVVPASEDVAADMYEYAMARLAPTGYAQYEVSNWATAGRACQHNLTYWRNLPYIGVGAGAHSSYGDRRFANVRPIQDYVAATPAAWQPAVVGALGGPVTDSDVVTPALAQSQTVILALRLNAGLDLNAFAARFGVSFAEQFGATAAQLTEWGLLEYAGAANEQRLRLTERGRLVGNEVFARFLPEVDAN
jgi:oxygen-independent coproporphyrinogen-3 oxidase